METWTKRNRRVAQPDVDYKQLSDPQCPMYIRADRQVTPALIRNMQALENKDHHLKNKTQGRKFWNTPVDAAAGIYPEIQIKQIFNKIPSYISANLSKLFPLSNYLMPYWSVGSTLPVDDVDGMLRGT